MTAVMHFCALVAADLAAFVLVFAGTLLTIAPAAGLLATG